MKLEKRKVNELTRQLENFKKKRLSEDLEIDDKVIIEVPIVMGSQLKDIEKNKEIASKVDTDRQKAVDEFKKVEQKNIDEAKKQIKSFLGTLDEHYKDLYLKEGSNYTVHCKGRRELRNLIEQCKLNNIRYKWDKLIEGDYRYDVKFSLNEDFFDEREVELNAEPTDEVVPTPQPEPQPVDLNNLKIGDVITVTQDLLNSLMSVVDNATKMKDTLDPAPIQEPVEVEQDTEIKVNDDLQESKKLNEERYNDDAYYEIEEALSRAGLDPQRYNDYGVLTKNLGWVVHSNGKTVYLTCDGTWLEESLKLNEKLDLEGLKKLLQDFKDGKFELDNLTIDSEGWVQTDSGYYSVEENLKPKKLGQKTIKEELKVVGNLEDYAPSDKAKPLYDEIVANGMLEDLDKLFGEIYQDGASINELNNLLANEKDFVRSMLGLDEVSLDDEKDQEMEQSIMQDIIDDDVKPASEKEPEPKSRGSVNDYFSGETGYGDEDDDEENLSSLKAIVDSKEAEEM